MPNMDDKEALIEWLVENRLKPATLQQLRNIEGYIELWRHKKVWLAQKAQKARMEARAMGSEKVLEVA